MSAMNEELRQAKLRKRRDYFKQTSALPSPPKKPNNKPARSQSGSLPFLQPKTVVGSEARRCYNCNKPGHLAKDCRAPRTESSGRGRGRDGKEKLASTKQVQATPVKQKTHQPPKPQPRLQILHPLTPCLFCIRPIQTVRKQFAKSGSMMRAAVHDTPRSSCKGSLQGVPARGIVDTGADISIMGGELLKRVAAVAWLRKRAFKKADKLPRFYDRKPFTLNGRLDLDITFGDKTMCTPIYLKTDAPEELLLSEGVCRQLGIVSHHSDVLPGKGVESDHKKSAKGTKAEVVVPTVGGRLLQSVRRLPQQRAFVPVVVERGNLKPDSVLVEYDPEIKKSTGLQVEDALLKPTPEGFAQLLVTNPSGYTQSAVRGIVLGEALEATVIQPEETHLSTQAYTVTVEGSHGTVAREDCAEGTSALKERRQKLLNLLGEPDIPAPEKRQPSRSH